MTPLRRVLPWALAAVLTFDLVGAIAARAIGFNYNHLALVSFGLYASAGFAAGRLGGLGTGVLAGLLTGLGDATVGWTISWLIGPGRPRNPHPTLLVIGFGVFMTLGAAVMFGVVGGLVAEFTGRSHRTAA